MIETELLSSETQPSQWLSNQDWAAIQEDYCASAPYHYTIVDNFLSPEALKLVRDGLITNKAWSYMNWQAQELFIRNFPFPPAQRISEEIAEKIPRILGGGLSLVQHIAFMHQRNKGLCAHSDTGQVTVNLWLTPDEYNLEPDSGGLVLYDVKRTDDQQIHEFNARPWCVDYLNAHTKGGMAVAGYKFNRAVIFDAKTFHASDRINFRSDGAHTYRINYAFLFDKPAVFRNRYEQYI